MKKSSSLGFEILIEEMKQTLQRQLDTYDVVKNSVNSNLSIASLLIGLLGMAQVYFSNAAPGWVGVYRGLLIVTGVAYFFMLLISVLTLRSSNVVLPYKVDWNVLVNAFEGMDDGEIRRAYLSQLVGTIDDNSPQLKRFASFGHLVGYLLILIVFCLFALVTIPRQ